MSNTIHYAFVKGDVQAAPMLLLHGTGGDEKDLLPIGHFLAPKASLLSIRGRVVEGGLNRYFRHTAAGEFDLDNLAEEIQWLARAILQVSEKLNLDLAKMIVTGYSNGANMAAKMILDGVLPFQTGIFFHPMLLTPSTASTDLSSVKIWMSHGDNDPIVPAQSFNELHQAFTKRHGQVTDYIAKQSHNLTEGEVQAAQDWLTTSGRLE